MKLPKLWKIKNTSLNLAGATNAPQSLVFRKTYYNLGIAGASNNYSTNTKTAAMILGQQANTLVYLLMHSMAKCCMRL